MGVSYTTKKNLIPQMMKKAQALDGKKVEVGIFDGDHAWLAGIHEYGCRIPVTPKMRAFLHYNGIHLKEDTKEILIPERSFLRSGFDSCNEEFLNYVDKILEVYLNPRKHSDAFLRNCGKMLVSQIKKYARDLKEPPKSEASHIMGTKNSNPLIETGEMIQSITYRIEDE